MGSKNSVKIKMSFFFTSLVFCIFLAEGALSLAARYIKSFNPDDLFYQSVDGSQKDYTHEYYTTSKKGKVVLTIGDSFTNAGNAPGMTSYPGYLYSLIKNKTTPLTVINLARCEETTKGAYEQLDRYFKNLENRADIAIIFVGAADTFRSGRSLYRGIKQNPHIISPDEFPNNFRLFKVLRYMYTSIKYHLIKFNGIDAGSYPPEKMIEGYYKLASMIEEEGAHDFFKQDNYKKITEEYVKRISPDGHKYLLGSKYCKIGESRICLFERIIDSIAFHPVLAMNYTFKILLDAMTRFPREIWTLPELENVRFLAFRGLEFQSSTTSLEILITLDQIILKNPEMLKSPHFYEFDQLVRNRKEVSNIILDERKEIWKKIKAMTDLRGTKVLIVNYPRAYQQTNNDLEIVASELSLSLLDTRLFFANAVSKYGEGFVFENDDHLTPYGYKLLADFIFTNLKLKQWI